MTLQNQPSAPSSKSPTPEEAGFRYDDKEHRYFVQEKEIPGVSHVLKTAGLVDTQWYTGAGRDLGTAVHAACHYLDENDLAWDSLHEKVVPRVRAYQQFKADTGFEPIACERPLFHPLYRYGGTFDRLGWARSRTELWLPDLKTGEPEPWFEVQTGAYEGMVREWTDFFGIPKNIPIRRLAVKLNDNGTWLPRWCKDPRDFQTFLACLTVTNWRATH